MAYGDITGVIDTHEFEAVHGVEPSFAHILDTLNCMAYQWLDNDGLAKSIIISALGAISEPAGNTLEFETNFLTVASTCLRPTDIFCIAYFDNVNGLQLEAIVVAPDGTLSQHANHQSLVSAGSHVGYQIIHIANGTVAIVMRGPAGWGRMYTWNVSSVGLVAADKIEYFTFHSASILTPKIAHVTGNVFVIAYQVASGEGYARTVNITPAGAITFTVHPAVEIDNVWAAEISLAKIADGLFVSVHRDNSNLGIAAVFEVTAGGLITVPTNNRYTFDAALCGWPSIVKVTDNIFGVAYTGSGNNGELKTISCNVAPAATWAAIGSLTFDATSAHANQIEHVAGNVYVVVYHQTGDPGQMATIGINTPSLARPHHEMMMKIGP